MRYVGKRRSRKETAGCQRLGGREKVRHGLLDIEFHPSVAGWKIPEIGCTAI